MVFHHFLFVLWCLWVIFLCFWRLPFGKYIGCEVLVFLEEAVVVEGPHDGRVGEGWRRLVVEGGRARVVAVGLSRR
jgi:hypothetical protein